MGYKQYCKEPEKIENYEKAKADNFKGWHCHHRLETHNSDGERRLVDINHKELKALGMYYNRPPEELIFLTIKEHNAFNKGKQGYWKGKQGYWKGKTGPNKGKQGYWKGKTGPNKGKKHSEETKKKMAESHKGMYWYNNGKINKRAKECPPGFTPGRIR